MEKRVTCLCGHEIAVDPESGAITVECPACGRTLRAPGEPAPRLRPQASAEGETTSREPCPYCLELILPGARKCPYCQEFIDPSARPPAAAVEPAPQPRTSSLAVVSLLLAIAAPFVCFLTTPPAFLAGIGGLLATRREHVGGRGMAIVGLLLSLLWVGLVAGFVVLVSRVGTGMPIDVGPPTDKYLF